MKEIMVWSAGASDLQNQIAVDLSAHSGTHVLADYALGSDELYRIWGPGECSKQEILGDRAWIDASKCIHCGACETRCHFSAIQDLVVSMSECRGCAQCVDLCAVQAISLRRAIRISWEVYRKSTGVLVKASSHQDADIATLMIKQQAVEIVSTSGSEIIVSSGPSLLDQTLFTTLRGVSLALIVANPSQTSLADFTRLVAICTQFHLPTCVYLAGPGSTKPVRQICREKGLDILTPVASACPSGYVISKLWEKLKIKLTNP